MSQSWRKRIFSRHFWEIFAAGDRSGSGKMLVCVTETGVSDSGYFTLGVWWSILDMPHRGNVPQLRSTPCFPLISHSHSTPRSPSSSLVVVVGRLLPPLFPSTGHLTCTTHAHTHISKGARLKNHCLNNLCSTDRPSDGAPDHCRRTRAGGRSRTEPGLLVKFEYELGNVDESLKCVKSFFRDGVIWRAGERASVRHVCASSRVSPGRVFFGGSYLAIQGGSTSFRLQIWQNLPHDLAMSRDS